KRQKRSSAFLSSSKDYATLDSLVVPAVQADAAADDLGDQHSGQRKPENCPGARHAANQAGNQQGPVDMSAVQLGSRPHLPPPLLFRNTRSCLFFTTTCFSPSTPGRAGGRDTSQSSSKYSRRSLDVPRVVAGTPNPRRHFQTDCAV